MHHWTKPDGETACQGIFKGAGLPGYQFAYTPLEERCHNCQAHWKLMVLQHEVETVVRNLKGDTDWKAQIAVAILEDALDDN